MLETLRTQAEHGWAQGVEASESGETTARGLINGAFTLLFVVIVLAISILVGGEFISAIPTDGPFGSQITTIEDNAGTSFELFAVGILVIPAAGVVGYLYREMGGLAGLTGGASGGLGRGR